MKSSILLTLFTALTCLVISFTVFQSKTAVHTSGAWQALQFWSQQRAFPGKEIPADKYFSEYEKVSASLSKSNFVNTESWESLGPHNIGGRTLALAFNPQNTNTIFAGSASGGLWRSYTGGLGAQAWEIVTTGYPVLG